MTDNEQRAHDLALILVQYWMTSPISDSELDVAGKAKPRDIYSKYVETYQQALNAFNRDFPTKS